MLPLHHSSPFHSYHILTFSYAKTVPFSAVTSSLRGGIGISRRDIIARCLCYRIRLALPSLRIQLLSQLAFALRTGFCSFLPAVCQPASGFVVHIVQYWRPGWLGAWAIHVRPSSCWDMIFPGSQPRCGHHSSVSLLPRRQVSER